ncbi:F0F1 ATP synthase subunit gamma [Bacteroides sp.]|uniref:F0F1 ATP synthase subunit gamma n=1 Tax=Bacteroides sp. TaxID=29523 RepID=UPI0011DD8A8A|nr:F0F1 ATP synthase subunit gamma [Bacteroides sp.]
MASLKEVKTRINSVKSTRKITSAMKMVASAKLHKAQGAIENMLPYQKKLNKILTNFLSADLPIESPYVQEREVKRVAIVVFSSNTSLCGAFNANVIKMMMQTIGEFRTLGQDNILIFPVGKKVDEAAKRMGFKPQEVSPTLSDKPTYQEAAELAHRLMDMYVAGEVDRVEIIYHHFKSMGIQILLRETYLPINLTNVVGEEDGNKEGNRGKEDIQENEIANDYIIEPNAEELIASLIPTVLSQKIFTAVVDSNASEHAARTLAMQVATDNANELIQDLTKQYNKSRQQAITNELLDIVGGSMK